ncbi:hypothetical protein PoB_004178400 [Plakobranchus ocellatus]|uniref:Mutator-like transposase domain-containing protein n=1 Tax=Plakobranchus ocellatus TaxID=259542 RepID=A0AAV4B9A1_9GAST|nr:hypothetical protein PoB_004178400 [Plakobranchus ocellatus]
MEVRIAKVLWGRSIQHYNLRYTINVSNGDSKSFNRLLELQPYGCDVLITKDDCINHVGKRLVQPSVTLSQTAATKASPWR